MGGGNTKKKRQASAEKRMAEDSIVEWLGKVNKACRRHAAAFENAGIEDVDTLRDEDITRRDIEQIVAPFPLEFHRTKILKAFDELRATKSRAGQAPAYPLEKI